MRQRFQFDALDYLRLFFADREEEVAIALARLLRRHRESDIIIHPDDPVGELLGWGVVPDRRVRAFLVMMEETAGLPKEAFTEIATFRELVRYAAARSRPGPFAKEGAAKKLVT